MPTYTVYVDDNFHYMDDGERYTLGEFADCQSACAACRGIVDTFLAGADHDCTARQLYGKYMAFGEDPWIGSADPECRFSAWKYAEQRCAELAARPEPASQS
jgi:hypothetical protein